MSFGARKTFLPKDASAEDLQEVAFTSKEDKLFSVDPENPATLQRLVLIGSQNPQSDSSDIPSSETKKSSGN